MPSSVRPRAFAHACIVAALLTACGEKRGTTTSITGMLIDTQLSEISGMAASHRHRDVLWLIDDGGNAARLFAVNLQGRRRATFHVEGVTKTDWEDLAAFSLDRKRYLLVADTGDNGGLRKTLQLHVIAEPSRIENARVRPAWSIAFRWPDGPRDCEAVAVDARRGQILLVSKKRYPPELFALPLRPASGVLTARKVGVLGTVPKAQDRGGDRVRSNGSQVTSASLSPDGGSLAVMTYRHLLVYERRGRWANSLARPAFRQALPWLPQAEALTWSADGRALYATGEFVPAPLYRIER